VYGIVIVLGGERGDATRKRLLLPESYTLLNGSSTKERFNVESNRAIVGRDARFGNRKNASCPFLDLGLVVGGGDAGDKVSGIGMPTSAIAIKNTPIGPGPFTRHCPSLVGGQLFAGGVMYSPSSMSFFVLRECKRGGQMIVEWFQRRADASSLRRWGDGDTLRTWCTRERCTRQLNYPDGLNHAGCIQATVQQGNKADR